MTKLPPNLLADSLRYVRSGEASCLGGIRRRAQSVRAHVSNRRGLPGGSSRCGRRRNAHTTCGPTADKPTTDLLGDIKLATSERARPGNRLAGTTISRGLRFEQPQHPLCAISGPSRDDLAVGDAECLWRPHPLHAPTRRHRVRPGAVERPACTKPQRRRRSDRRVSGLRFEPGRIRSSSAEPVPAAATARQRSCVMATMSLQTTVVLQATAGRPGPLQDGAALRLGSLRRTRLARLQRTRFDGH
jgi:hypothetical protein